jgi:arabinosaccharide transport system substrate-binding protein
MSFPFGRAIAAMILCSLLTSGLILSRRSPARPDLVLWVSADTHAKMYSGRLLNQFQHDTGKSVQLDLITQSALDVRLLSLFMFSAGNAGQIDRSSPDLVEVEIGSIGKYFRPPVREVGFLPLNSYLRKSGWMDRIVKSRFSPWTKDGVIFGVPDDLHPCTLSYRKDLFDQAGVDLSTAGTWDELQSRCLVFQRYWADRGQKRMALGLSSNAPDMLMVLLRQQHVQLVDSDLCVHLTDPRVVHALCWYAQAVAGPGQIAMNVSPTAGQNARELAAGNICGLITPDWMVADLKEYGPDLAGTLRMIPLPRFSPADARTASWGGTMIGITRTCRQPDTAWKLIESLYLDRSALATRQTATAILPPIPEYWQSPVYHQDDPFYGGQKIDEMYITLADELPPTKMTAYTMTAQMHLSIALNQAVARVQSSRSDGPEVDIRADLAMAQQRVERMIQFDGGKN